MPLYLAIPYPGIKHKKLLRTVGKVLCERMFTEALFVKEKNGNKCSTVWNQTNQLCDSHTIDQCGVIKRADFKKY